MQFSWHPLLRILAALIIGVILGSSAITVLTSKQLDYRQNENQRLLDQLNVLNQELVIEKERFISLKRNTTQQKPKISKVQIRITLKDSKDEFTQLGLEKKVRQYIEERFLGRELATLDPITIPEIINDRTFTIDGATYKLKVKTTLVSEAIFMDIEASKNIKKNLPAIEPVGLKKW